VQDAVNHGDVNARQSVSEPQFLDDERVRTICVLRVKLMPQGISHFPVSKLLHQLRHVARIVPWLVTMADTATSKAGRARRQDPITLHRFADRIDRFFGCRSLDVIAFPGRGVKSDRNR
jgi:hypothetical protein